MLDHILGRPSATIRRSQIFLVLFFWTWRLYKGDGAALPSRTATSAAPVPSHRVGTEAKRGTRTWLWRLWMVLVGRSRYGTRWIGRINERLKHFTPYQLILGTFTLMYAIRHLDDLLGVGAPEPLARLYSRSYYRATYINTAFDAGFASAMSIRPKWLKDLASMLFSVYYLVWANEGDEVLRRFRALCTVEMLRVTWEKTRNPYIRLVTAFQRPYLPIVRNVTIPRPPSSSRANLPPVKGLLFFDGTEEAFAQATEMVVDFPGGGFIAMGPDCHEERLRRWAKRTGKPVLGIDYGKAPEYPYPWAIEEGFDAYRTLMETNGSCIGIESGKLSAVLTGDSAGGNICTTIVIRILEHHTVIPRPTSIILAYPALDFNFTSWMSPNNLRVLRTEHSENHIPGIRQGKDHMRHKSPLATFDDVAHRRKTNASRQRSWGEALSSKLPGMSPAEEKSPQLGSKVSPTASGWTKSLPRVMSQKVTGWLAERDGGNTAEDTGSDGSDSGSDDDAQTVKAYDGRREADKSLRERVKTPRGEAEFDLPTMDAAVENTEIRKAKRKAPIGTRLTMTSRVGYFQDRTISPSMMRAMAILYVGPRRNPDFETDYYISPMLAPAHVLAHFPPVYLICGERDPFVDDTVIFAGKIREAKRARRAQAEFQANGKSARFGEGLRMSAAPEKHLPDPIIRESDEDWVQMRIIEGWGHGFMQMAALMKEVDRVLTEMADWIDESFERVEEREAHVKNVVAAHAAFKPDEPVLLSPTPDLIPPTTTHVKPVGDYPNPITNKLVGGADLGSAIGGGQTSDDDEEGMISFTPKARQSKRTPPPSKFLPVPRRPSKDALDLHRSSSAPRFDVDETGSSGEVVHIRTPPLAAKVLPYEESPKGSGAFAFFNASRAGTKQAQPKPIISPAGGYGTVALPQPATAARRTSNGSSTAMKPTTTNSLVAAAVAGARAASPALAAAGLVPQSIGNVSEAELMRRRRLEAVFGMGETDSAHGSDAEDEGSEHE